MTEITAMTDLDENEEIDWLSFFAALFLAPLLVALLGFWAAGILVFALFFGVPTYLLFGAPLFAFAISRFHAGAWALAGWAFVANLISTPAVNIFFAAQYGNDAVDMTLFVVGFGCGVAPLWGLTFGFLYRQFHMDKE